MLSIPRIATGVEAHPLLTPSGLRYRLMSSHRGAGSLVPARTLVVLLLMDGQRSLRDIHREITELGIKITDPGKLIEMVRLFEASGVVEVAHSFQTITPLRHTCGGCGRSCEGHLVGPISSEEGADLEQILFELNKQEPDVPSGPATKIVKYLGEDHRVLTFINGQCIFLTRDNLCRIHRSFGSNRKPLPCRMFPIRVVRTETGTRITIAPRCFSAHKSYDKSSPLEISDLLTEWGLWRPPALLQGLDPEHPESLIESPAFLENLDYERLALAYLEDPGSNLVGLLALMANHEPSENPLDTREALACAEEWSPPPTQVQQKAFAKACHKRLHEVMRGCFSIDDRKPPSRFGCDMQELIRDSLRLDPANLPPWSDLPTPTWEYLRFCYQNLVFGREVMVYGGVPAGVLAFSMGVMLARWLTPLHKLEAGPDDDFVRRASTWFRMTSSLEVQSVLFSRLDDAERLLDLLCQSRP